MHKQLLYILFTFFIFSCSEDKVDNQSKLIQQKILNDIVKNGKSGDIILKKGYGLVSQTIVKALDEKIQISHCGILHKDTITNEFYIIHSVARQVSDADGVQKISLKKFVNDVKPKDFYLMRYNSNTDFITNEALCYLEKRIPFDHKYNLDSNDELYCSEFIYKIFFSEKQFEVFKSIEIKNKQILLFNDIFKNDEFSIIIKYI